jgi:23S rRNA pseudouridine1911/1915/1917 synthase
VVEQADARMNHGWVYCDRINRKHSGKTVLAFYVTSYRHSSTQQWQERIMLGQILLNGQPTTADTVLQGGQVLTYHRPPWQEPDVPLALDILHHDPQILVVAKPAGLPVLPGGGFVEHTLLWQIQQQYPQAAPIHRLGRGTSGLLLLAQTPTARAHLSAQMRQHQMGKTYRALIGATQPADLPNEFMIDQPIGKIPHPGLGYIYAATAQGLSAHSHVKVLQRSSDATLIDVTIYTGRPHQIRIHLASVGYPLLGDPLYGPGGIPHLAPIDSNPERVEPPEDYPVPGDCGYHLHAYQLKFRHPDTEELCVFQAPAPERLRC